MSIEVVSSPGPFETVGEWVDHLIGMRASNRPAISLEMQVACDRARELLGLLLEIEWCGESWSDVCPCCGSTKLEGHTDDCKIYAATHRSDV